MLDKSFCPSCNLDRSALALSHQQAPGSARGASASKSPVPVLSLEHILELRKGVDPGEFAFLCPLIELGDRLVRLP